MSIDGSSSEDEEEDPIDAAEDLMTPMFWISLKIGTTEMRGGRQYKVHVSRPGCPDKLGCSENIADMVPVGKETSAGGATCKRCAKLWPSLSLED